MLGSQSLTSRPSSSLLIGIALSALGLPVAAFGEAAATQSADEQLEEVVVTGTLIRGAAPTGANLITVSREEVTASGASTTSQLLATIPQIANMFNGLPQLSPGTGTQLQVIRPNLRNTPSGNTATGAATLILVDGHRMVGVGVSQSAPDPDAIPPGAIERVEVITDGGSSTYGADAIGGVINYITRRKFDGIEVNARQGWADNYKTFDTNITAGRDIGRGSLYVSFNYAKHDDLFGRDRAYVKNIDWNTGIPVGQQCDVPNITVSGVSYALPARAANTFNSCDPSKDSALYPSEARHTFFVGLSQDFTPAVKFDVRAFYTNRTSLAVGGPPRAAINVAPTNFYYQPLPTPASQTATQSVGLSFGPALGNDYSKTRNKFEEWGITPTITWDISDNWQLRGMINYGDSKSSYTANDLNTTLLQQYGSATGSSAATAINYYNIAAPANQTLLANAQNWELPGESKDKITNLRVIVDGALFAMPGGKLRVAAGAEYMKDEFSLRTSGGVVPGGLSNVPYTVYSRNVKSAFGELQVPTVGADNAMSGLRALDLSISVRYDKYSDFGNTTNPKYGLSYKPVDWITLRGNWGKSFNAPTPVDQLGGLNTTIGAQNFFQVAPPGSPPGTGAGQYVIALQGASTPLQPQTAKTYSFGIEIAPPVVPGLRSSVSYYHIDYRGALAKPPVFAAAALFSAFPQYVILRPTVAQIQAYQAQAINPASVAFLLVPGAPPVYELLDFRTYNLGNTKLSGLDMSVSYIHDTGFGSIDGRVSGNKQVTHYTQVSSLAPFSDDLIYSPVFSMSASFGATIRNFRAQATLNHSAGYNVLRSSTLLQDHVSSFSVLNLFFRYGLDGKGVWQDMALTLSVNNALDQSPPVFRTSQGIGGSPGVTNGATVGRLFQVGISKKF